MSVAEVRDLATWILQDAPGWDRARLDAAEAVEKWPVLVVPGLYVADDAIEGLQREVRDHEPLVVEFRRPDLGLDPHGARGRARAT